MSINNYLGNDYIRSNAYGGNGVILMSEDTMEVECCICGNSSIGFNGQCPVCGSPKRCCGGL